MLYCLCRPHEANDNMFIKKDLKWKDPYMREFWTTVGAMVLGYFLYLGVSAIFRK